MGRIILALAGLIALSCVVLYAVFLRAPLIERDIENRATQLLTAAGLGAQITVEADGRALILSGDEAAKDKATAIAEEIFGVVGVQWAEVSHGAGRQSNADDGLRLASSSADGWHTRLVLDENRLSIQGDRPSLDSVSNAIVARLSADFGGQNVSMDAFGAKVMPVYWADTVNAAAKALNKMVSGSAEIRSNKLLVEGVVAEESDQAAIKQLLVELTPSDVIWGTEFETQAPEAREIALRMSPAQCNASVAEYMAGRQVQFRKSKTSLQDSAFEVIDGVLVILSRCPSAKVQIGGYTDSRGDPELNKRLSRERAETVRDYLIEKGINMARLDARGFGPQRPIATNKTARGRAENRRIEFRVIGE